MYLWGGGPINLPQVHNNEKKRRLTSQVYIFDITSGNWDIKSTKGSPPLGVSGYFCATVKEKIFYFGGWCRHDNCYHNILNELDTSILTWTDLERSRTDDEIAVMKRANGGMMPTKDRLLLIGDRGSPPLKKLPQAQYYWLPSGRVRTNEHNMYDLITGQWIIPETSGQCMPPISNFTLETISNTRAIIFGGVVNDAISSNTVYVFDVINNTMHWQTIAKSDSFIHWPKERYSHATSIVTGSAMPSLLVILGGQTFSDKTIKDCWIFLIDEKLWTKINLPESVCERYNHSVSAFIMGPYCVWLIVVGGKPKFGGADIVEPYVTMLVELVFNDGHWSVEFVLDSNDLTLTDEYQQRFLKRLIEGRRKWTEQQIQNNLTKNTVTTFQPNHDLFVYQQQIRSLQEQLLEVKTQLDSSSTKRKDISESLESITTTGNEVTDSKNQSSTICSQLKIDLDHNCTQNSLPTCKEDPSQSPQLVTVDTLNCEICRRTLVQCTDTIVVSNIDPIALARKLYSKEIISEDVYKIVKDKKTGDTSTDRLDSILDDLKDRVKHNGSAFMIFLDILRDDSLNRQDLADKIMSKYKELAT